MWTTDWWHTWLTLASCYPLHPRECLHQQHPSMTSSGGVCQPRPAQTCTLYYLGNIAVYIREYWIWWTDCGYRTAQWEIAGGVNTQLITICSLSVGPLRDCCYRWEREKDDIERDPISTICYTIWPASSGCSKSGLHSPNSVSMVALPPSSAALEDTVLKTTGPSTWDHEIKIRLMTTLAP